MVSYQWVSLGPPCHPEISGKLTTEVGRLPGAPPVAQDFQGKNSSIECPEKWAQNGCLEFIAGWLF